MLATIPGLHSSLSVWNDPPSCHFLHDFHQLGLLLAFASSSKQFDSLCVTNFLQCGHRLIIFPLTGCGSPSFHSTFLPSYGVPCCGELLFACCPACACDSFASSSFCFAICYIIRSNFSSFFSFICCKISHVTCAISSNRSASSLA